MVFNELNVLTEILDKVLTETLIQTYKQTTYCLTLTMSGLY